MEGRGRYCLRFFASAWILFFVILLGFPPSSFAQDLELPFLGVWNGFNSQLNVIECANISGEEGEIRVSVYTSAGEKLGTTSANVPASGSVNIILNTFPITDLHGTYRIEHLTTFEPPELRLSCFTAIYRFAPPGSSKVLEYGFVLPVRPPLTGVTSGIYNSMNIEGGSTPVYNWLSVYNPGILPIEGVVKLYDLDGNFEDSFSLPMLDPGERTDLPLGHDVGQKVGLYEILLFDLDAPYGAFLTRYSESSPGVFRFAFPLTAQAGTCDSGLMPASTMDPATNWAEIANPTLRPIVMRFELRDSAGTLLHSQVEGLSPYTQRHIQLNPYLGPRNIGTFRVNCVDEDEQLDRLIVQSVFYGYSSQNPQQLAWAYASQANDITVVPGDALVAPVNTFHGAANWFKIWNGTLDNATVKETLHRADGLIAFPLPANDAAQVPRFLAAGGALDLGMHELAGPDFTGAASVSSMTEESLLSGEMLRVFPDAAGGIGYIVPIPLSRIEDAITSNAQHVLVGKDTPKEITLSISNEERDDIYFWIEDYPEFGSLSGSSPYLTYTPDEQYIGTDSFTFRAWDGTSSSFAGKVTIDVGDWPGSIGVPPAPFGHLAKAPKRPARWTSPVAGFYYVDQTKGSATDTGNDYGTPSVPRRTIPAALPPGSVVELHGRYDPGALQVVNYAGTADSPIYIRGKNPDTKPFIVKPFHVSGSYLILEHLEFGDADEDTSAGQTGEVVIFGPAHHVTLRYSDVHGNQESGGVHILGWVGGSAHNIVVHGNNIHSFGNRWAQPEPIFIDAVSVGTDAHHIWITDNDISSASGYGVNVSAENLALRASTHHIYVSGNESSQNGKAGIWVRHATDVVVSKNEVAYHYATETTPGACIGTDNGPSRVWLLYNNLSGCEVGIATLSTSTNGGNGLGDNIHLVGNLIHHLSNYGESPGGALKDAAAIRIADASTASKYILHNTIANVGAGIMSAGGTSPLVIANNIFHEVEHEDVQIDSQQTALFSSIYHSLFGAPARVRWGSTPALDVKRLKQAFPGLCDGCAQGEPEFDTRYWQDFHLTQESPGVDAGSLIPLVQLSELFQGFYGMRLNWDFDRHERTQGINPDLGAFELNPFDSDS